MYMLLDAGPKGDRGSAGLAGSTGEWICTSSIVDLLHHHGCHVITGAKGGVGAKGDKGDVGECIWYTEYTYIDRLSCLILHNWPTG